MPNCHNCQKVFEVLPEDLAFYDKVSPVIGGEKFAIPAPGLCPDCRMQRRLSWRNERNLYRRKCDLTGRPLISMLSADKPYKVYDQKEWWSDKWSPQDYGRDFDFSRGFFEQFAELLLEVPNPHIISAIDVAESNCEYTNFAGNNKDCYLVFDTDFCEKSAYSNVLKHSVRCFDCSYVIRSELLYECVDCVDCYNLNYSQDSTNCSDSYFLKNCSSCRNCIGCVNLQRKEYYIFNEPYSKEEYQKKVQELGLGDPESVEKLRKRFQEHVAKFPQKFFHGLHNEDSDGDFISNTQNVRGSFNVGDARDCAYCDSLYTAQDCFDVSSFGEKIELVYEAGTIGLNTQRVLFSHAVVSDSSDVMYSSGCRNSRNLFGCVNMKRAQYCVFNKQYSKEEYEDLVGRIIEHMRGRGEWGEFFPVALSLYGYNESVAQQYFPLTQEQAAAKGYKWKDEDGKSFKAQEYIVPLDIGKVQEDILEAVLACGTCGKNYKIVREELEFYRSKNLPIPRQCAECRHKKRMGLRNPRRLWERSCDTCGTALRTSYAPERPEKVYCEKCYLAEVY